MGYGIFGLWIWGVTLTDEEADVVYGLVTRMNDGKTGKGIPMSEVPQNERAACPKWVGFEVQRYYGLHVKDDILYRALRFDDPRVPIECPHHGLDVHHQRWRCFTDWLGARGVHLRGLDDREGAHFVTDYD